MTSAARDRGVKQARVSRTRVIQLSLTLFLVAFPLFLCSCGPPAGAVPSSAKMGRCPVCGMMVKASDPWACEIYYKDGTKILFESPGDMLAFYSAPARYKASPAQQDHANIERISVKDYATKHAVDAAQASFVYKSRVEGPMGQDFLPFEKLEDAQAFVVQNGGQVVTLNGVTREMVEELRKS